MSGKSRLDERLRSLAELRQRPDAPETPERLARALRDRSGYVVAKAAAIAAELGLASLAARLTEALARLLAAPASADPGTRAKLALLRALVTLGVEAEPLYLAALRHVQLEPRWGGSVDTAAELRGEAGLALARCGHARLLVRLADLLADPEPEARAAAAHALAAGGQPGAALLLRLKLRLRDRDPRVSVAVFEALLALAPEEALELAASLLRDAEPLVAETTAITLGGSRLEAALPLLTEWWREGVPPELCPAALTALALLREPAAIDLLLEVLGGSAAQEALAAAAALRLFADDGLVLPRVEATLAEVPEALRARLRDAFQERD